MIRNFCDGMNFPHLHWISYGNSRNDFEIGDDGRKITLIRKSGSNIFVSAYSKESFPLKTVSYFEVQYTMPTKGRTFTLKDQIKIGVCMNVENELSNAFSDHSNGWAFYPYDSALRHQSSGSGIKYGKEIKNGGTIGVIVDTLNGEISFCIDGENFGVAFKEEAFINNKLYAAIAVLEIGTCFELATLADKLWERRKGIIYARMICRLPIFRRLPDGIFREITHYL
ncbi:unnamed protein product [Blepharisma stoltei]|uniref:B30.2/SPRY domain-containing protein n=1 Tax=Blepharisma stoltei TaxID=1481888 RepID=A0AAU9J8S1_9CILI|nr:unnamed protein product [Blepharisma stoltei]